MKKYIFAALLGTLASLSGCMDDKESEAVTNIREQENQRVLALAQANKAKAEAEIAVANAQAALSAAQARLQAAQANNQRLQNEIAALEEKLANAATEKERAELELAKKKAQADLLDNERKQAEDKDLIERQNMKLEQQMLQAQLDLMKEQQAAAENNFDEQNNVTAYSLVKILYVDAINSLNYNRYQLYTYNKELVALQNGLVDVKAQKTADSLSYLAQIARNNYQIEQYKLYKKNSTDDLDLLKVQYNAAKNEYNKAYDDWNYAYSLYQNELSLANDSALNHTYTSGSYGWNYTNHEYQLSASGFGRLVQVIYDDPYFQLGMLVNGISNCFYYSYDQEDSYGDYSTYWGSENVFYYNFSRWDLTSYSNNYSYTASNGQSYYQYWSYNNSLFFDYSFYSYGISSSYESAKSDYEYYIQYYSDMANDYNYSSSNRRTYRNNMRKYQARLEKLKEVYAKLIYLDEKVYNIQSLVYARNAAVEEIYSNTKELFGSEREAYIVKEEKSSVYNALRNVLYQRYFSGYDESGNNREYVSGFILGIVGIEESIASLENENLQLQRSLEAVGRTEAEKESAIAYKQQQVANAQQAVNEQAAIVEKLEKALEALVVVK